MRLCELASAKYHANISSWISRAKVLTIEHVIHVLKDESKRDKKWFVLNRGTRLKQLITEILTISLEHVSNGSWSESDFEGKSHSDIISNTIDDVLAVVGPFYKSLKTQLVLKK